MLSKTEFCKIIAELKEITDMSDQIDEIYRNSSNSILRDFGTGTLLVAHQNTVAKLLEHIFCNIGEAISWWCWEANFGRNAYKYGIEDNGQEIILETSEQLYDYLVSNMENVE